jgi:hypothetical protein
MQRIHFLANLPAAGLGAGLSASIPADVLFSGTGGGNSEKKNNILEKVKLDMFSMREERTRLRTHLHNLLEGCLAHIRHDGLFHHIINDPPTLALWKLHTESWGLDR